MPSVLPTTSGSHSGKAQLLGRFHNLSWGILLNEMEVLIQQTIAVVTNRDIVGQTDDQLWRVGAGFLLFRRRCDDSLQLARGCAAEVTPSQARLPKAGRESTLHQCGNRELYRSSGLSECRTTFDELGN